MRGKLRPRVGPKAKDWNDVLRTVIETGLPAEQVIGMRPSERAKAKQQAAEAAHSGYSVRADRIALWRAWEDDPNRFGYWDWHEYLESIGRSDLLPH